VSEGSVYQRKDGRWVAKWKDINGQWKYLYHKTKTEAKQALRKALKDRDEGIVPVGKMTLNDLLDSWLEDMEGTVSRRTLENRQCAVRVHIAPTIGTQRLSKLSHKDFARLYRDKIADGLKPSSVKRLHTMLKQAFRQAVRRKYIAHNPLADVKPPRENKEEKEILSPDQVRHLLETVRGDRFELAVLLGATCALRIGETLSLRWEDFDVERGTVTIQRTLWAGKTWPTKTVGSKKTLKLPKIALDALKRVRLVTEGQEWLFPTSNNTPIATGNFHPHWKRMLREAGLPASTTFHSLRHGVASQLLDRGIPLPIVSRYLRHANPGITASVYSHIVSGTEGLAADGIDEALE
jgi:integrase